jgi:CRP-like cAMP-binding protein
MGRVKSFIMDRGFPPILARRIKYHFKHQLHRTTVFDATSAELVAQLPPPAACAVAFSEFRSTMKRITFLRVHPPMFVKDVLQCMKSFTCNAGDYINRDQDMGLCLFLLESGTVKRYLEVCPSMTSLIERASQATTSDVSKPPFSRSSSTEVEAQLGTPLELALSLALPLGFSVEWVHIPGTKGALMVVAVETEEQAVILGVRVGMWLQFAGGLPMTSVEHFEKELSKRNTRGEATCNLVFRTGGSKYLHFDTLTSDSVFGEAPLVLHSKQFVTSVAATNVCELWFIPKEELFVLLDQWPEVKTSLVTKACDFLNDVLELYMEHNHTNCPESIQEMAPHAQLDDILEDVVSGDAGGNETGGLFEKQKKAAVRYLKPDALVATMAGVSDPTNDENMGGRARMIKSLRASFRMPQQGSGNVDKKALLTGKSLEARFGSKDPLQSPNLPSRLGINTESSGTDNSGGNPSASSSTPSPRSKAVKEAAAQAAIADRMEAVNNYASDEDERAPGFKTIRQTTLDGAMTPRELAQQTGLFHPESPLKMVWDVLMSQVILYSVITITYQIGFASYFTGGLKAVDYVVDILFAVDILASFNTAVVDVNGNLISSRKQVSNLYLKGWFPIDFISTLPIDLIIAHFAGNNRGAMLRSVKLIRAVRLVRLIKIVRIIKLSGYFDKLEDNLSLHPAVLRLLNLFVIMGFFAHLFACLLYSVAQCDDGSASDCWIENYCVGGREWFEDNDEVGECLSERGLGLKYLVSIYWAFTTMTTIG